MPPVLENVLYIYDLIRPYLDFGVIAVLIYCLLYFLRGTRGASVLAGCVIVLIFLTLLTNVLKFEVLTANDYPLTEASPLQFSFNWGESYTWTPGDGLGLNTHGQWQTVTLPLAPMATAGISVPGTWQSLRIAFQPTAAYTADFRIGNLRIEHR